MANKVLHLNRAFVSMNYKYANLSIISIINVYHTVINPCYSKGVKPLLASKGGVIMTPPPGKLYMRILGIFGCIFPISES